MLQFHQTVGPLLNIVSKMSNDFFNFFVLFIILTVMFAIIGNINFMTSLGEFEGLLQSLLTIIDASMGNFDFVIFNAL